MDLVYFCLRHTPWWSVPLMFIGAQFAYTFWLKDRRPPTLFFSFVFIVGFVSTVYYVYAGGPEATPMHFHKLMHGK